MQPEVSRAVHRKSCCLGCTEKVSDSQRGNSFRPPAWCRAGGLCWLGAIDGREHHRHSDSWQLVVPSTRQGNLPNHESGSLVRANPRVPPHLRQGHVCSSQALACLGPVRWSLSARSSRAAERGAHELRTSCRQGHSISGLGSRRSFSPGWQAHGACRLGPTELMHSRSGVSAT